MSTERTPLTTQSPPGPAYVFPGVSPRTRKREIRHFQCCICTLFIAILTIGLAITISYSTADHFLDESINSTIHLSRNTTDIYDSKLEVLNGVELVNYIINLDQPIIDESCPKWILPKPFIAEINQAKDMGLKDLGDREIFEENVSVPPINSPSFRHQRSMRTTAEGRKYSRSGYVENQATLYIAKKYNYMKAIGRSSIGNGPKINVYGVNGNVTCDFNSQYRTFNGTCNNNIYPDKYGVSMTPFRRALFADYGDGISSPRLSFSGKPLPSARQISTLVHRSSYSTDPNFTVMLAVWGQFLDHDITATAINQGPDGDPIECCIPDVVLHSECFPVPIEAGDYFFDGYNLTCMNFIRSAPAATGHIGPREQLNQATSFIDGSVIYGNSNEIQHRLRTHKNGTLRMFLTPNNRTLLPISTDRNDGCNEAEMNAQGKYCFESGDARANENLHLTSMHLLWARQHNFLANHLREINQNWNDETVFQEARRILIAQMQFITYNEFLPVLFNREFVQKKGLLSGTEITKDTYNSSIDPSISNNFATAAFRFGHTLLPGLMKMNHGNNTTEEIQLHKILFNPYLLWQESGIDHALESAINTPLAKFDQFFTTELTQNLFQGSVTEEVSAKICGLDLVSLNIQRGRDHGLPGYYEWRKHCQLPEVDTWEKLSKSIDSSSFETIKKIYSDPKDVDLYTGALLEPPLEGALVGPLLACLITDQFLRIKMGDSHWFERTIGPQSFTKEQLNEIYNTTLASILCQNGDAVDKIQKFVMEKLDDKTNPNFDCTHLNNFNFSPWKSKHENLNIAKVKTDFPESNIFIISRTKNDFPDKHKL